jgi:hypothetical protein
LSHTRGALRARDGLDAVGERRKNVELVERFHVSAFAHVLGQKVLVTKFFHHLLTLEGVQPLSAEIHQSWNGGE